MERLLECVVLLTLAVAVQCRPSLNKIRSTIEKAEEINIPRRDLEQLDKMNENGVDMARSSSVVTGELPNPRMISNTVHMNRGTEIESSDSSLSMGQFLGHDLIATQTQGEFSNGRNRRQLSNVIMSYNDAFNIYGSNSSQEEIDALREPNTGFLRTKVGNANDADGEFSFPAGDQRKIVVPSLTAYSNGFVLLHNLIAYRLNSSFPDPDTLFQETRKVVIGIMQKIVYDEFLPSVLSPSAIAKYNLMSSAPYTYDPTNNATLFDVLNSNLRGRDHGLASYTEFRKQCGLSSVTDWSDLIDHDQDAIGRLQNLYESVDDIDLFNGSLTEIPVAQGTVGPTQECIVGDHFMRLKFRDRFWYQGDAAGFSSAQQEAIRDYTMSRLMCDVFDFIRVHYPNAFISTHNITPCEEIPALNVDAFRSQQQQQQQQQ